MTHVPHFRAAAELLKIILEGTLPADAQMDRYFRARREMGVRDRGFVAETVYGCLREKRMLEYLSATNKSSAFDLVAAYLVTHGYSGRALEELGYRGEARQLAERVRGLDQTTVPFAVRANLPDWLAERLLAQFSDVQGHTSAARGGMPEAAEAEALALVQALNQPATLDLRVNTFKAERAEVQARLTQEGVAVEPTPYSPIGLRRAERAALFSTQSFKDGLFEVQDEGSQLLSYLLEPKRNEMIVDFCAGAGGKTLHIGSLMANTGTVYAFDVSAKRLEKLTPRLRRAGLGNVRTVAIRHERDDRVRRLHGKINRVLVDAPCSGTGTLRRNPDIKWRALNLPELVDTQKRILAVAAQLVKPGGRLVYATCSLLREENENIVEDFLATHADFHIVPAGEILARRHIPLEMPGPALRLLTHRHHTDSFYAAVLDRSR